MSTPFDTSTLEQWGADFDAAPTKQSNPKYAKRKYTCESCGGTGKWRGGVNRHGNAKCNTCHGHGKLVTSPQQRSKARAASRKAKADKFDAAQEQNAAVGNGTLLAFLRSIADWNSFGASLLDQHNAGRAWSDKQIDAARRMWVKIEDKRRQRDEERAARDAAAPTADATRIRQMFADALANGKKRRALHAGNFDGDELTAKVVLTPARAPRAEIWVKVDDTFCGGIDAEGKLKLNRAAPSWLPERLLTIAADPDAECRLYGQKTGTCACCGRELTNALSIKLGIGPVCREKWGLV